MLKRLVVLSGVLIGVTALGSPQEDTRGVSSLDAIAARQASLDMSAITFHSMEGAMKAGQEAKSQGYPAMVLAKWAKALPRMFPSGTGQRETSAMSQALPLIWRDRANFDTAAANYAAATAKLAFLARRITVLPVSRWPHPEVDQTCTASAMPTRRQETRVRQRNKYRAGTRVWQVWMRRRGCHVP